MLALRGHLGDPTLDERRIRFFYHYTHPHSPARGNRRVSWKAAGYLGHADGTTVQDWFKHEETVLTINRCVKYWADTLAERTSMDNINDRLYRIAMFDVGTTVRKRPDGFLEVRDFTGLDTSALEEIFIDTTRKETVNKDGTVTATIVSQKVRLKAYNAMHGAKLFAHIKGELNQNKFGNQDTPHRLLINGVRGTKVTVELGNGHDAPIEVNAEPAPAKVLNAAFEEEPQSAAGSEFGGPAD